MHRLAFRLVLGTGVVTAALFAPALGPERVVGNSLGYALAEEATAEKEAFEAAKELGTVEAWDAFLSSHPTGFYADLARAYVKKLADEPAAQVPAQEASAQPSWCRAPQNAAERAICREPDLSSADEVMNVAYKRAKFDSPKSVDEIDHEQKRWLGRRGDDPACIRRRYDEQIQLLESFFAN
jgi:uncharacterized protein YecT (DUF1311 family)